MFPPLPGAANNVTSSEKMFESKMADVVRGHSRLPGAPSGNSSVSSSMRASSNTPSPVATPVPNSVPVGVNSQATNCVGASGPHPGAAVITSTVMEARPVEAIEAPVEEEALSSSQEEDLEETRTMEPIEAPVSQGVVKAPVAPPVVQRPTEVRPSVGQAAPSIRPPAKQLVSPTSAPAPAPAPAEAPGFKFSYAQMAAAQKTREASASNGIIAPEAPPASAVTTSVPATAASPASAPASSHGHKSAPVSNGTREPRASQPQNARMTPRIGKENQQRADGQQNTRPENGRRNSKESSRVVPGKFERRKADSRAK